LRAHRGRNSGSLRSSEHATQKLNSPQGSPGDGLKRPRESDGRLHTPECSGLAKVLLVGKQGIDANIDANKAQTALNKIEVGQKPFDFVALSRTCKMVQIPAAGISNPTDLTKEMIFLLRAFHAIFQLLEEPPGPRTRRTVY